MSEPDFTREEMQAVLEEAAVEEQENSFSSYYDSAGLYRAIARVIGEDDALVRRLVELTHDLVRVPLSEGPKK